MTYLDKKGKKRFSPSLEELMIKYKNTEVLSMLKGENLSDLIDCDGTTLLHLAVEYHNTFIISYLIDKKLDVNAVNRFGETPLMLAIYHDLARVDAWQALLDAGADLWEIKNNSGQSALIMFIQGCGHKGISKLIMNELEKRCRNIVDIVDVLLSADCQLYHLNIFKKVEITKLMFERGCPVNLKNPHREGNTALHVAAEMNDIDNVKVLLQLGADKNVDNFYEILPVAIAISHGTSDVELIKLLIPDGKDWIEKGNNMVETFKMCSKEVMEILLQLYDNILNARNGIGRTPLYYLARRDKRLWEIMPKNVKLNLNASDNYGISILHQAMQWNNPEAIRFLLDAGANVNVLDEEGRSPLFYILYRELMNAKNGRECVELLMQNGADAQLVSQNGDTIVSAIELVHRYDDHYDLLDPILAHLAIIEVRGSTLNPIILNGIDANSTSKNSFARYKQELVEMKEKKIFGTVSFFKFLTDPDVKICKYVQNEEIVKELSQTKGVDYLHRLLRKRFERAMEMSRLRSVASQFLSECIQLFIGEYVVLENILDFLDIMDLRLIATCTD